MAGKGKQSLAWAMMSRGKGGISLKAVAVRHRKVLALLALSSSFCASDRLALDDDFRSASSTLSSSFFASDRVVLDAAILSALLLGAFFLPFRNRSTNVDFVALPAGKPLSFSRAFNCVAVLAIKSSLDIVTVALLPRLESGAPVGTIGGIVTCVVRALPKL